MPIRVLHFLATSCYIYTALLVLFSRGPCCLQAPRATAEPSQRVPAAADHDAADGFAAAGAALDGARRLDACGPSGNGRRRGKRHRRG